MKRNTVSGAFSVLLITSTVMSLPTLSLAKTLSNYSNPDAANFLETPTASQKLIISVASNSKIKFPNVKDAIKGELEGYLEQFARGNSGKATVEALEVRGNKLYMRAKIRHHHTWKKPWGGRVTVYSLTNSIETSLDPLNPNATLDKTRLCFDLAKQIGGGTGRPHHVKKQSLFSIELKLMSLNLAYCENFRRSLWGLKNNQARKERFFRWFLTFVVIKSNLDAFALTQYRSRLGQLKRMNSQQQHKAAWQ